MDLKDEVKSFWIDVCVKLEEDPIMKTYASLNDSLDSFLEDCKQKIFYRTEPSPKRAKICQGLSPRFLKNNSTPTETKEIDVLSLKIRELRVELRKRGLETGGLKRELQSRLMIDISQKKTHIKNNGAAIRSSEKKFDLHQMKKNETFKDKPLNKIIFDGSSIKEGRKEEILVSTKIGNNPSKETVSNDCEASSRMSIEMLEVPKEQIFPNGNDNYHHSLYSENAKPIDLLQRDEEDLLDKEKKVEKIAMSSSTKKPETNKRTFETSKLVSNIILKEEKNILEETKENNPGIYIENKNEIKPNPSRIQRFFPTSNNLKDITNSGGSKEVTKLSSKGMAKTYLSIPLSMPTISDVKASEKSINSISSASTSSQAAIDKRKKLAAARKARLEDMRGKKQQYHITSATSSTTTNALTKAPALVIKTNPVLVGEPKTNDNYKEQRREVIAVQSQQNTILKTNFNAAASKEKSTFFTPSPSRVKFNEAVKVMYHGKGEKSEILSPMDTYEMSDGEGGSSSSEEEDDSDTETKKRVPSWAQSHNVQEALKRQNANGPNKLDPDLIFGEVSTCNLELIFKRKKKRYERRTSSGYWEKDEVTLAEKLEYKKGMGFKM